MAIAPWITDRERCILVDCALVIPFVLWVLSNYFLTIPVELEGVTRVDGASRLGELFRVVLPPARPGFFAAIMFDSPARRAVVAVVDGSIVDSASGPASLGEQAPRRRVRPAGRPNRPA